MSFIELSNYSLSPKGTGAGLHGFDFDLSRGDVCSIYSDSPDDACLFLKALATLAYPSNGTYQFDGKQLDFLDYRKLLGVKKDIGYIACDSAMLSNRSVRDNLMFMRYYYENSHSISLDYETEKLCRDFGLINKLDTQAANVDPFFIKMAITIREFAKASKLLLIERPEEVIGHNKFALFIDVLQDKLISKIPLVFFSYNVEFTEKFSNRSVRILNGVLN